MALGSPSTIDPPGETVNRYHGPGHWGRKPVPHSGIEPVSGDEAVRYED
jgi:hypothetical protein